jgi:hypothetical protein
MEVRKMTFLDETSLKAMVGKNKIEEILFNFLYKNFDSSKYMVSKKIEKIKGMNGV